jgi:SAM-dependent methyltransferase
MSAVLATRDAVLELATEFRGALLLQQAVALGLFERLAAPASTAEVAAERGWRADKVRVVLEALAELQLLEEHTGRWQLAEPARRFLLAQSEASVAAMVEHEWAQRALWQDLERVFSAGDALREQQDVTQREAPERAALLLRAMRGYHPELRSRVGELAVWKACSRVVDLAGGHGAFLAEILRRSSHLTGVVADLPTAAAPALETLAEVGVGARAAFVAVDIEAPASLQALRADGVLLCRALHNFGPRQIEAALHALALVLGPAGHLVVVERSLGDGGDDTESALFAAYMAVNCRDGWVPPTPWLRGALARAGFALRETIRLDHHVVLVAAVEGA